MNQSVNPQKTSHTSPYRASYGVPFEGIFKKIYHAIRALHCSLVKIEVYFISQSYTIL